MLANILTNWLFLSIVSCIATALLIVVSSYALNTISSSTSMVARIIGTTIVITPFFIHTLTQGKTAASGSWGNYWLFMGAVGLLAAASWFSFYLALEIANTAGRSAASVTAINYASVALVLLIPWLLGTQAADWKNWLGIILVVAGVYLTCLRPAQTAHQEPSSSITQTP